MLILGILGSPRRKGNTATLLDLSLEGAREEGMRTELLFVQELMEEQSFPFCKACSSPCSGRCYRGTSLEEAFRLMAQSDGIILASPVYFGTVSAQLKAFWDKTRRLREKKVLMNVVGGALSVGGSRFGGQETTLKALFDMMLIQGMLLAGEGHISTDAGHHGACGHQPVSEDENARLKAFSLGRRIGQVAGATYSLRKDRETF